MRHARHSGTLESRGAARLRAQRGGALGRRRRRGGLALAQRALALRGRLRQVRLCGAQAALARDQVVVHLLRVCVKGLGSRFGKMCTYNQSEPRTCRRGQRTPVQQ